MARICIKDLLLRTEVGFNPHEVGKKQDVLLNLHIHYRLQGEERSDAPAEALDYRSLCKEVIALVEGRRFQLLEKLAADVADFLLTKERVEEVEVEVDKPHALRFARSVSFYLTKKKSCGME